MLRAKQVFLVDELPLTPFAKVARYRLRQLAVEHRINVSLTDIAEGLTATCIDPLAKRVTIASISQLTAPQFEEVARILSRLDLQLDA